VSAQSKANARRAIQQQGGLAYQTFAGWGPFRAKVPPVTGRPEAHKDDAAESFVGILMGWTSLIDPMVPGSGQAPGYGGTYYKARVRDITFAAMFAPALSWRDPASATDLTLRHEQGHFDIMEVKARRANLPEVIARIKEQYAETGPTPAAAEEQLRQRLVALCYQFGKDAAENEQKEYDDVTVGGRDRDAQDAYSKGLAALLATLPRYW
jgi:hypothetical protein